MVRWGGCSWGMLRDFITTIGLNIDVHFVIIGSQLLCLKTFLGSMLPQYMALCMRFICFVHPLCQKN